MKREILVQKTSLALQAVFVSSLFAVMISESAFAQGNLNALEQAAEQAAVRGVFSDLTISYRMFHTRSFLASVTY
jgi:hypothetical protein